MSVEGPERFTGGCLCAGQFESQAEEIAQVRPRFDLAELGAQPPGAG